MNLGTLNTIIALVVVLLVLSLVVQSIQTAFKKLFTLKSRQLQESLRDLYDQAIGTGQPPSTQGDTGVWSWLRKKLGWTKRIWSTGAHSFTEGILDQFKKVGRVTRFGNPVLDSLSKDDLLKVVAKLELKTYFKTEAEQFEKLCEQIKTLSDSVETLTKNQQIAGAASAKISQLRAVLSPLFNDVQAIVDGNNKVKPQAVFGDLLRLRSLEVRSVLDLVSEVQTAINSEIELARKTSPQGPVETLQLIAAELAKTAKLIGDLSQRFDQALAPLRARVTQIEIWFDTVTQSFDERYTRNMRTWSILISIVVVVLLNANFFAIYRKISTNEIEKNLIVEAGPKILEEAKKNQAADKQSPTATPTPAQNSGSSEANSETSTPSPTPFNLKKEAEETKRAIQTYVDTYEQFGFAPLSGEQYESLFRSSKMVSKYWTCDEGPSDWGCTIKRSSMGAALSRGGSIIPTDCREIDQQGNRVDCVPTWRSQTKGEWWSRVKSDLSVLLGWAVMVMLLSVGAPFWQDTLESLFGIKNLLRQKSQTQNVEQRSGAGQTRS